MVTEALDRISRLDPAINAVVALRAEGAYREAETVDAAIARGEPVGPLAGVPVLVKDLEDVAGMATTQGSRLFADAPPATSDGLIPARLRAAGAIIVGKTNLPEFATEGFTDNLLFGATGNPWSLAHSPGGSSGGSAAAVAAGMVPIATATDGGGSIRIPAAFCGLVGLKPTHGVIGRYPPHDWIDFSTFGPFATSVADLRLLLAVEAGPVAGDPTARPRGWAMEPTPPPARLYAAHRTSDLGPLPPGILRSFEEAAAALGEVLALPVTWLEPTSFFADGDPDLDWFTVTASEHVAALGRDWVIANLGRMHPATQAFMEVGLATGIDAYLAARRRRFRTCPSTRRAAGSLRPAPDTDRRQRGLVRRRAADPGRRTRHARPGTLFDGRPERDRPPSHHPAGGALRERRPVRPPGHGAASRGRTAAGRRGGLGSRPSVAGGRAGLRVVRDLPRA